MRGLELQMLYGAVGSVGKIQHTISGDECPKGEEGKLMKIMLNLLLYKC